MMLIILCILGKVIIILNLVNLFPYVLQFSFLGHLFLGQFVLILLIFLLSVRLLKHNTTYRYLLLSYVIIADAIIVTG